MKPIPDACVMHALATLKTRENIKPPRRPKLDASKRRFRSKWSSTSSTTPTLSANAQDAVRVDRAGRRRDFVEAVLCQLGRIERSRPTMLMPPIVERTRALLASSVYSIGRYGGWTYCSIEDNIVEARQLVAQLRS